MYGHLGHFASFLEDFIHLAHSPSSHQHLWWLEYRCSLSTQLSPLTNSLSVIFFSPLFQLFLSSFSLDTWFSAFLQPGVYLAMSRNISVCYNLRRGRGAAGIGWVEARDSGTHPATHRSAPTIVRPKTLAMPIWETLPQCPWLFR